MNALNQSRLTNQRSALLIFLTLVVCESSASICKSKLLSWTASTRRPAGLDTSGLKPGHVPPVMASDEDECCKVYAAARMTCEVPTCMVTSPISFWRAIEFEK